MAPNLLEKIAPYSVGFDVLIDTLFEIWSPRFQNGGYIATQTYKLHNATNDKTTVYTLRDVIYWSFPSGQLKWNASHNCNVPQIYKK